MVKITKMVQLKNKTVSKCNGCEEKVDLNCLYDCKGTVCECKLAFCFRCITIHRENCSGV